MSTILNAYNSICIGFSMPMILNAYNSECLWFRMPTIVNAYGLSYQQIDYDIKKDSVTRIYFKNVITCYVHI